MAATWVGLRDGGGQGQIGGLSAVIVLLNMYSKSPMQTLLKNCWGNQAEPFTLGVVGFYFFFKLGRAQHRCLQCVWYVKTFMLFRAWTKWATDHFFFCVRLTRAWTKLFIYLDLHFHYIFLKLYYDYIMSLFPSSPLVPSVCTPPPCSH